MKSVCVFLIAIVSIAFAFSCKKTGVNQNLDPNNQKTYDFMSTKKGSYWKYGSRTASTFTRYARDKDTMKNNLKLSYFERYDSIGNVIPEYFGKNGPYYLTLLDLNGGETNYLEYVFWKDSAAKGDSWTNVGTTNYPGIGDIQIVTESTESDDNLTLVSNGKTYEHVVHVHSDIRAPSLLNLSLGTLDVWFIKGLALIREEANIDVGGFYKVQYTDSLLEYHIEQ